MLRSVNNLCENKLGASDGEIGHIKDFYFDDLNWTVRYLVVDTGSWMPGRQVLISPHAFGDVYQAGRLLLVNLTRQQIENSPSIELHKPVSRQYEEEYHRYYGWPFYWEGGDMWGVSPLPVLSATQRGLSDEQSTTKGENQKNNDSHLRSARTVIGHQIQATDHTIGHVTDFLIDDKNWAIQHVVVDAMKWLSSKKVMISPSQIARISWDESKMYVDLTKDAILKSPVFDPALFGIVEQDPRILG